MPKQIVFDSFALMSFFQNETGADTVREMILDSVEGNVELSICSVNLGEVWYAIARKTSTEQADIILREIQSMPIEIVDADWTIARQAASYKLKGGISYADCYSAALGKLRDAEVVTGDKEFKTLEKEVKVLWLK
jgi:PIN domain nuclease of toxin-antitoxin system